jgi:predicted RNase H-like nuclease
MTTLIVGFDSAWTPTNTGAIAGVLQLEDGTFHEVGLPLSTDYCEAKTVICRWQAEKTPTATIIMLDQPTIVKNAEGQRPVENLVGAPVSLRYGGVQPANTTKKEMFGKDAPVWRFLTQFGGAANPLTPLADTRVFETYPVLALIALGWTLPDVRATGRLPKYNPDRKKTFSISDWQHVCKLASAALHERGLKEIAAWLDSITLKTFPHKREQDGLDACVCLLVALHFAQQKDCLMVGDLQTGYMVVPHCAQLRAELEARCCKTGRVPSQWVRVFQMAKQTEKDSGNNKDYQAEPAAPADGADTCVTNSCGSLGRRR